MKKIILSLATLLGTLAVSAQSYPKQPDPSTYNVVKYQKPVAVEEEKVEAPQPANAENAESRADGVQEKQGSDAKTQSTASEAKNTSAVVAENRQKAPARKEK
jgi:hypothetical protein